MVTLRQQYLHGNISYYIARPNQLVHYLRHRPRIQLIRTKYRPGNLFKSVRGPEFSGGYAYKI